MGNRLAPNCCCDPCKIKTTGFTPTSPIERSPEDYPAWQPNFAYTPGDVFWRTKIDEFDTFTTNKYKFEVPIDFVGNSGAGWNTIEQARYTEVDPQPPSPEKYDEITEWHMIGTGWGGLTINQKHTTLNGGGLVLGSGYLSKQPLLPIIDNWNVLFNGLEFLVGETYFSKFRFISQASVSETEGVFSLGNHLFCEIEQIDSGDEPTEEVVIFSTPYKITLGQVVGGTETIYDTTWAGGYVSTFCRKPGFTGAIYAGGATPGVHNLTTIGGFYSSLDPLGLPTWVATASGIIATDSNPAVGLTVTAGDLIQCSDCTDAGNLANWSVLSTSPDPAEFLSSSLSVQDPTITPTGLHVGIYCYTGASSTAIAGSGFTGVTTRRNGFVDEPSCEVCNLANNCPCENDYEFDAFGTVTSTIDHDTAIEEIEQGYDEYFTDLNTTNGFDIIITHDPLDLVATFTTRNRVNLCKFIVQKVSFYDGTRTITNNDHDPPIVGTVIFASKITETMEFEFSRVFGKAKVSVIAGILHSRLEETHWGTTPHDTILSPVLSGVVLATENYLVEVADFSCSSAMIIASYILNIPLSDINLQYTLFVDYAETCTVTVNG